MKRTLFGTVLVLLSPALAPAALAAEGHGFVFSEHGFYIIDFALLVGVLVWAAKKPVKSWLTERAKLIQREIDEARALHEAAQARLVEYEQKLAALEAEQQKILASFVEAGEREKARIVSEAEAAATKLVADAERRIGQESKRLQEALEHEAVELAVAMSETVIRKRLEPTAQQRMITDYIAGLESMDGKARADVFANL